MVTVLIVEDNPYEGEYYLQAIRKTEVIQESLYTVLLESGEEALQWIGKEENYVDIFVLDVELPGINGFLLAEKIRQQEKYKFAFMVFLTGYGENLLAAFREYHCYDYIIKPITEESLMKKMGELVLGVPMRKGIIDQKRRVVSVRSEDIYHFIELDEILFAETIRNGCKVYKKSKNVEDDEIVLKGISLKRFVEEVDDAAFLQCHKSFALNTNMISNVRKVNYRLWEIQLKGCSRTIDVGLKYMGQLKFF